MSDPTPTEYDCRDCGVHVYAFGRDVVPEPPLCAVCAWLDEFVPDPAEREAFRARGLVRGGSGGQ